MNFSHGLITVCLFYTINLMNFRHDLCEFPQEHCGLRMFAMISCRILEPNFRLGPEAHSRTGFLGILKNPKDITVRKKSKGNKSILGEDATQPSDGYAWRSILGLVHKYLHKVGSSVSAQEFRFAGTMGRNFFLHLIIFLIT